MAKEASAPIEKAAQSPAGNNFRMAEAYRMIRTNLLFALAGNDNNVVLFSSAEPSAGKSTLCCNLAIVMAQTGARVLLVDADMRKPVQHRHFRLPKSEGLSKILGGFCEVKECIQTEVAPNLDLLPSGAIPPNPSELLGTPKMLEILETVKNEYDYVFVDMPPMSVVSDALILAPRSAGVVLVARQKQTTYDELQECLDAIERAHTTLLGVVVSDVHDTTSGYGGRQYYYRRYDYHYGR